MAQITGQLMTALSTAILIICYFVMLLLVGYFTSRKANNETFFTAHKSSPWYLIAFGMIGTSISGVTFISVPGKVGNPAGPDSFAYLQFVLGNFAGFLVIIGLLLPLYYKLNVTSIYSYLGSRFGKSAQLTGSFFFLLSRTIGAAARLYIIVKVLQIFIFDTWGMDFTWAVILLVSMIMIYTLKGGVKTIIWTDTLQTFFLVTSLVLILYYFNESLGWRPGESLTNIYKSSMSKIFFFDGIEDKKNFFKQFLSGFFITIAMTGLDQDLMQKNLTCKNLKEAQKNMFVFSFIFMGVVLLFLTLGALMYFYIQKMGIEMPLNLAGKPDGDGLLPMLARFHFPLLLSFTFIIGLIAAAFASADSALTSLTTSFCIDFLQLDQKNESETRSTFKRKFVHITFSVLIVLSILVIYQMNNQAIIDTIFKIASYTYGPLLGLFAFGLLSKYIINGKSIPLVAILSIVITYLLELWINYIYPTYKLYSEMLIANALILCMLMLVIRRKKRAY